MKERVVKELFLCSASVLGLFAVAFSAFSRKSKREIHQRDGHLCINCGSSVSLEASHQDHTKGSGYDDPDGGDTLCTGCHIDYHASTAGENGLTPSQNDWAISMLKKRL